MDRNYNGPARLRSGFCALAAAFGCWVCLRFTSDSPASYRQNYADSPFYRPISALPTSARVEGWSHGSTKANGIVIDLSESDPSPSPDFDEIRGWSVRSWVDRKSPAHTFHYLLQYDQLNVAFGYDLLVEPVKGTDEIRCTFKALTDPEEDWHRNEAMPLAPLSLDLTPLVIKSGSAISITTLPLGAGKIAVIHYLLLTRTDLTPNTELVQ